VAGCVNRCEQSGILWVCAVMYVKVLLVIWLCWYSKGVAQCSV